MQEEIRSLEATVHSAENIFGNCSSLLLLKPMFANLKFSTLRIQVGDYLKSYGKFCFSVLCTRFHVVKPGLTTVFAGVNEVLVLFIESGYRNFILNLSVTVRTTKSLKNTHIFIPIKLIYSVKQSCLFYMSVELRFFE